MPTLAPQRPEVAVDGVPERRPRWIELATSTDHKEIGLMYVVASLSFLFLGIVGFLLMRTQLAVPESTLIDPVTFNRLLSINGATLVVLFAIPLAIGLYTYVVPLQIGARGVAFPRLANFSLWLYVAGGVILYSTFMYTPPESGVNPLPPLSDVTFTSNNGPDAWIAAVGLAVLGFVLQALNLAVTIKRLRAPGMVWRRLPIFSWSAQISSYVLLVVGPLMLAALAMLEIDRQFDGVFFDPGEGGAPLYFQHLSWLFFNGAYLLMLLPAIGVVSEILPVFSRQPLFHRGAIAGSMAALAALGLLAWMQNMFTAAIPEGWLYFAMAAALAMVVPIGLIIFNWIATMAGGTLWLRAPMLYALAAISTLTIGLVGELAHSVIPIGWALLGTTDATANTGFVLVGGSVLGGLAALHYWFPKITGRTMGETMARLSLLLILAGVYLAMLPLALAGLEGMPVDVYKFYEGENLAAYNAISSIGALLLAAGIIVSLANALASVRGGVRAGHNPWGGETLEWYTPSPPPPHNFDAIPDVRSATPLRDIRDWVGRGERDGARATVSEPERASADR